jgi:hypothetical protein
MSIQVKKQGIQPHRQKPDYAAGAPIFQRAAWALRLPCQQRLVMEGKRLLWGVAPIIKGNVSLLL